jgi:hypothetical protein
MTTMEIRRLDTIVLARDLPAHGLRAGDLGAVVGIYIVRTLDRTA